MKKQDLNIKALQERFGDAFYLLDSMQFRKNYCELKEAFDAIYPLFNIAYSYKTNYTPKLCKIVNELGGYAEVVSEMELELALKIGVRASNIIWNGPIKKPELVEKFLLVGGLVNIDSINELEIIKSIAYKHMNNVLNLGIRCNYDIKDDVVSRFGFDIDSDEFTEAISFLTKCKNVKLVSLHCHFAKRQIDYWPVRVEEMIKLVNRIGVIPDKIDLGGGIFGKMEDSLKKQFYSKIPNYLEYAETVAKKFKEGFINSDKKPELIIEPGSALVGDCMKFFVTIKSIKCIRGKYFASVYGSQKNISMSNINPPIEIIPMGKKQKKYENIDLVGYTCIENDVLFRNFSGNLAVDDVIVISNCGSYSIVMKPPFILPNFPILEISHGKLEIIKREEKFYDIFRTFLF